MGLLRPVVGKLHFYKEHTTGSPVISVRLEEIEGITASYVDLRVLSGVASLTCYGCRNS